MNETEEYLERIGMGDHLNQEGIGKSFLNDLENIAGVEVVQMIMNVTRHTLFCENYDCQWEGYLSECHIEWESEGWGYPEYQVASCPICGCGVD